MHFKSKKNDGGERKVQGVRSDSSPNVNLSINEFGATPQTKDDIMNFLADYLEIFDFPENYFDLKDRYRKILKEAKEAKNEVSIKSLKNAYSFIKDPFQKFIFL